MRLITKKLQEQGIVRLLRKEVEFLYVRTNYNSVRQRRGSYYFKTVVKFYDREEEMNKYSAVVTFQPDDNRYYLHNLFLTEEADRSQAIKNALYNARENQGRTKLSNIDLLDRQKLQQIVDRFITSVNCIETWGENRNGYPFKRLEGFGRFVLNIQEAI